MIRCAALDIHWFLLDLTLLSGLLSNWIILGWGVIDVARLKYILIDLQ